MFPLLLDLSGRRVVVIGAGTVGIRKATVLVSAGAQVHLVCRESRPEPLPFPLESHTRIRWTTADYISAFLDEADLVVAAATFEVNRQVVADAKQRGLWVNSASEPETGNLFFPAVLQRGDLQIAVSTGGAAPALARAIRDELAEEFDQAYADWIALLAEMRPIILSQIPQPARRRELFKHLAERFWVELLRRDGLELVRRSMRMLVQDFAAR